MTDIFTQLVEKIGEVWSQVQVWLPISGTTLAAFIFAIIRYAYKCIVESGAIKLLKNENTTLKEANEKAKEQIIELTEKVNTITEVTDNLVTNTINPTVRETCSALLDLVKNNDIITEEEIAEAEAKAAAEEEAKKKAEEEANKANEETSTTTTTTTTTTDPSSVGFVGD